MAGSFAKRGQPADSAKAIALDALVRRNLMVLEAEARGMEQDDRRQRMWKKVDADLLKAALEQDLTKDVVVTDEEMADLLERSSRNVVTREIAFDDSATAARVTKEIQSGKLDFAAAAKRYSKDPAAASTGGLSQPVNEVAIAMGPLKPLLLLEPGQIYGPFRFRQLFYIARLESRQPLQGDRVDEDVLRPRVLEAHRQEVLRAFLDQMKRKYHYRFDAPASHRIAEAVTRVMAEEDARVIRVSEAGGVPPDGASLVTLPPAKDGYDGWGISDSLRARQLYVHDKGSLTVGTYLDRMAKVPIDYVATSTNPSKIELYCDDYLKDEVYPIEAKARGLDVAIDYERTRRNRYEQLLVDQLYREEISDKIKPDLKTLQAYWRANAAAFPPRPVIVATTICFATEADVNQAKLRIDQGLAFDALAKEIETGAPAAGASKAPVVMREQRATKQETWLGIRLGGAKPGDVIVAQNPEHQHCLLHLDRLEPGEPDFTSSYDAVLEHYRAHNDEVPFRQF
ncbi:MAG TPA: peptidylprolyl isomerase, partial [Candidatus Udaeobacter sp.]|nr:peptidylprolyl isomerase [Candidatus Udaeobacter sp.]